MISVSVIIPVYNSEEYLSNALNSVMMQKLTTIEIICVDDGSVDHSKNIIEEFCKKDNRIIYLYQNNSGPGAARNYGMQYAAGEYIAFLDSDDEYPDADSLMLLYTKAKQNDAQICGGSVCGEKWVNQKGAVFLNEGFCKFVDFQNDYMFWRFIYQKRFLEEKRIKFPEYRNYEDPVFLLAAMDSANVFYAITESVYQKNESHLTVKKQDLTEIKHMLAGIENNIRIAQRKKYYTINQHNLDTLCLISGQISEMLQKQTVDTELYEQLIRVISLISVKKCPAAEKKKIIYKIRAFLPVIHHLAVQKKRIAHCAFLLCKIQYFSIIYVCMRARSIPGKVLRKGNSVEK